MFDAQSFNISNFPQNLFGISESEVRKSSKFCWDAVLIDIYVRCRIQAPRIYPQQQQRLGRHSNTQLTALRQTFEFFTSHFIRRCCLVAFGVT